jgi:HlyD family secretion protein
MRRTIIISTLLLISAVFLGFYYFYTPKAPDYLTLYGNVDVRLVDISFRVPGQVVSMPLEEGDIVKKGMLLATLDKTPYDNELRQAYANIESTRAQLDNAKSIMDRRRELIKAGAVAQEDLETAEANWRQFRANLKQTLAAYKVSLDNLTYTEAYAPSDGIILTRVREPGTVVNPADPVYTVSISSPVWIRAFVSEPNLGQIYYGMPAEIFTDTQGGPSYTGQIGFISPISEFTPKTVETTELRTDLVYRLRVYAENPDQSLKQGMPVTVKLYLKKKSDNQETK